MSQIHHAVAKKAAANQVSISYVGEGQFEAVDLTTSEHTTGPNATELLARVLAARPKAPRAKKPSSPVVKKTRKAKKSKKRRSSGDEDEGGDEDEVVESKSVVKAKYKKVYKPNKDTNGDDFAQALHEACCPEGEGVELQAFARACRYNSIDPKKWLKLKNKQGDWNSGMGRMNLGNVLRGKIRRGEEVKIGGKTFKGSMKSIKPLPKQAPKD